jgi:probable phosphoglycerate mutase
MRHGEVRGGGEPFPADDELVLTERGRRQVMGRREAVRRFRPDLVVTSPLTRARQTVTALGDAVGDGAVSQDACWLERDFYFLRGLTSEQIIARYGESWHRMLREEPDALASPGLGSLVDCQARVVGAALALAAGPAERILVVAHGGPFAWLASWAMGTSLDHSRRWHMDHAALSTWECVGDRLRLLRWNADSVHPSAL